MTGTTTKRALGPDAVWQTHADVAAEQGIFDCQQCHGEPVSAVLSFEDGQTFVGESCYRNWQTDPTADRRLNA